VVEGICVTDERLNKINNDFQELKGFCDINSLKLDFEDVEFTINFLHILKKMISPPIIGCILGIILGVSNMTNVLYSTNFYITNIVNVVTISYKAYVPLLFLSSGIIMIYGKGVDLNSAFNKYNLYITIALRAVIMPLLGLAFIYLLKVNYGHVVLNDRLVRFAMYMPWILPASPNFTIIVNLLQYYKEELGYVLIWHNALIFIYMTLALWIYFLTIG